MKTLSRLIIPGLLLALGCDPADAPIEDDEGSTSGAPIHHEDEGSIPDDVPSASDASAPSDLCAWNGSCGGIVDDEECDSGLAASCGRSYGCIDADDIRLDACFDGGSSSGGDDVEPEVGPNACPPVRSPCFEPAKNSLISSCEEYCGVKYGTRCATATATRLVFEDMNACMADARLPNPPPGARFASCGAPLPQDGEAVRCLCESFDCN